MSNVQVNPFLSNLPIVFIARSVRKVGNETITTPDTSSKRIWGRVGNHRVIPVIRSDDEIINASGTLSQSYGLDKIKTY